MSTPKFPRRDPADREFWDLRYGADFAPWDSGRVPERLREFVRSWKGPRRVLVPGCGSAWDVRHFAENGWEVLGLDFSPEALKAAAPVLGPHAGCVREGDFFAPVAEAPFPVVYERAFLCALPPRLWSAWAARVAELVVPGGVLAGFFFFDEGERGPPFPLSDQSGLDALLDPSFARIEDRDVHDSIEVFAGRERWQVWQRKRVDHGAAKRSDAG